MSVARRDLLIGAALAAVAAGAGSAREPAEVPALYRTTEPAAILAAARALMARDMFTTLITVDPQHRPRARTVLVSAPDADFMLWMATRPDSRKLAQIAGNHAATLHFADDASAAYASLMGEARIVDDPALIATKNPYEGAALKQYFPDFPRDFVLIGFRPHWLEIATADIASRNDSWQPQGLRID